MFVISHVIVHQSCEISRVMFVQVMFVYQSCDVCVSVKISRVMFCINVCDQSCDANVCASVGDESVV